MKKNDKKTLIVTSILCLLPILLGVILYNKLPDKIAIHFDMNNVPDNYFPKPLFVFGIPVFMMLLQVFCCIRSFSDKNRESNRKANVIFEWLIPILTICLYCLTILFALGNDIDIRIVVMIIIGISFIIVGNYLPKTKSATNINFGLLNRLNGDAYNKAAHISGYVLIIDGLLFIISILFKPIFSVFIIVLLVIEALVITIYSLLK